MYHQVEGDHEKGQIGLYLVWGEFVTKILRSIRAGGKLLSILGFMDIMFLFKFKYSPMQTFKPHGTLCATEVRKQSLIHKQKILEGENIILTFSHFPFSEF